MREEDGDSPLGTTRRPARLARAARSLLDASTLCAIATVDARGRAYVSEMGAYRAYLFRPRRVKLFDEPELGAGTFVTARVRAAGELVWERTEVYDPAA